MIGIINFFYSNENYDLCTVVKLENLIDCNIHSMKPSELYNIYLNKQIKINRKVGGSLSGILKSIDLKNERYEL